MSNDIFVSAVIVAGGSSTRMGKDKLLSPVSGVPVFIYSMSALGEYADELILVIPSDKKAEYCRILSDYQLTKPIKFAYGADTRAGSALNGIAACFDRARTVLIHDAARPFVCGRVIKDVINAALSYGAAIPVVPLKDTVKFCTDGTVINTPDRSTLYSVQTPQGFDKEKYLAAAGLIGDKISFVTDDASLFEYAGYPVRTVEGDMRNIKLTTPEDMIYAEAIVGAYPEFGGRIRRKQCSE